MHELQSLAKTCIVEVSICKSSYDTKVKASLGKLLILSKDAVKGQQMLHSAT